MKVILTRSEKLLSYMVRLIFYGFKSIGLAPISFHTKARAKSWNSISIETFLLSKIGLFYNIVLLILVPMFGILGFSNLKTPSYASESAVTHIIDETLYISCVFSTWLIILCWTLGHKNSVDIMNRLLYVHRLLSAPKAKLSNIRMVLFLAVHMTVNVSLWTIVAGVGTIFMNSFWAMISFNIPQLVVYWLLMEYSIVLGLLARELENLNGYLLTLKEFPDYLIRRPLLPNYHLAMTILPTNSQLAAIKLLHNVRTTLSEVSLDVSDFFSLPILFSVAATFLALLINCYYIVIPVFDQFRDKPKIGNIYDTTWTVICLYPLILLAFNVTKTKQKANLTKQLVHKLLATAKRREVIAELEQFSIELMHENLSFTAYGFFELDFTLIQSIFGVTATYIIIVVQFYLQSNKT